MYDIAVWNDVAFYRVVVVEEDTAALFQAYCEFAAAGEEIEVTGEAAWAERQPLLLENTIFQQPVCYNAVVASIGGEKVFFVL